MNTQTADYHQLVRKVRARKVVAACACGWEVGVQDAFDNVEAAYDAHLWALQEQRKPGVPMQSVTSADRVNELLVGGDWKLVSVTKGFGFPGDPEFIFWMVHRAYA